MSQKTILLTGATGYVGSHLLPSLLAAGHRVRCMTRDPHAADFPAGAVGVKGDVLSGEGLAEAIAGCHVAFYLVHSMEAGAGSFADRDKRAAANFAAAARAAGTGRTIYLGGLEGQNTPSEHLRSRHEVAQILAREGGAEFVYARAAMIIGSGSASFEMVRHLVNRLPVMVCPRWIDTRTQPIAVADLVGALTRLAVMPRPPEEVQLGGSEVVTYRDMMQRYALLTGRRSPLIIPVPVLTPRLSSYWVTLVTPLPHDIVRPLVEGLGTEMLVTDPPPPTINDAPVDFDAAVRAAIGEPQFGTIVSQLSDETSTGPDGSVKSHQAAEIELPPGQAGRLWTDASLERLARTYWAFLSHWTLGLVRVHYTRDERYVCLLSRRLRLLTFAAPEYELEPQRARVRWRIKRGLLVAPGDHEGFLGITVTNLGAGSAGTQRVRIDVDVENFYPSISHRFSRLVYAHTQSRIHVLVTYGFLRRLVRKDLETSVTGRFA